MKVSEIAAILARAKLPAPGRDQLMELAGGEAGKRFADALHAFAAGDASRRDELEATVLVLDPKLQAALKRAGCRFTVGQLAGLAQREQRRFFDAIAAIENGGARSGPARVYLAELGLIQSGAGTTPTEPAAPPYYNFHIFGASGALCISEARTRKSNQHTVQIEGANALDGGSGRRAFDWPNKITVQLTVQEAYQVLALLENKLRTLKFDGHGRGHDKSLQIAFQDSHYFIRLIQRGRAAVSVPVRAVDAIPLVSLLYRQLLRNEPHLRIEDIRMMVDRMAEMNNSTVNAQ
jgi:hypothetical protein